MQAVCRPLIGKLSDDLGRRRIFTAGLASNVYFLIGARANQGLAGGSLLASAYGVIGDSFANERARAVGILSGIFPLGAVLGSNLGGILVDHVGWRWIFALNFPLGLAILAVAFGIMPPGQPPSRRPDRGARRLPLPQARTDDR